MNILSGFAHISLWQLFLVAGVGLFASGVGGGSGYGTGALMPLVLVPLVGPEPVVPIIALSALLNNSGRVFAFFRLVDWRRSGIALIGAIPFVMLSAYGFTLLTGKAVQILIGVMLILMVPLRYAMRRRATALSDGGLLV